MSPRDTRLYTNQKKFDQVGHTPIVFLLFIGDIKISKRENFDFLNSVSSLLLYNRPRCSTLRAVKVHPLD